MVHAYVLRPCASCLHAFVTLHLQRLPVACCAAWNDCDPTAACHLDARSFSRASRPTTPIQWLPGLPMLPRRQRLLCQRGQAGQGGCVRRTARAGGTLCTAGFPRPHAQAALPKQGGWQPRHAGRAWHRLASICLWQPQGTLMPFSAACAATTSHTHSVATTQDVTALCFGIPILCRCRPHEVPHPPSNCLRGRHPRVAAWRRCWRC